MPGFLKKGWFWLLVIVCILILAFVPGIWDAFWHQVGAILQKAGHNLQKRVE